ncbi:MAG: glycosyltransferase [Proteobacteria bacterium]|nr:glycosyltransferase [Pseudomonadota bacterium]
MQTSPELSIIVPAHNAGSFIRSTIESIRAQKFESWECIVVDDGSTDDTFLEAQRAVSGDCRFRLVRQICAGRQRQETEVF